MTLSAIKTFFRTSSASMACRGLGLDIKGLPFSF
jgi:hypothetical protein